MANLMIDRHQHHAVPGGVNRSVRILMITHGYPPSQISGAEMRAHRKARWWVDNGHTVEVIAADATTVDDIEFGRIEEVREEFEGVPVVRVRFAAPDASRLFHESWELSGLSDIVAQRIAAFNPDVIYQISGYLFGIVPSRVATSINIPIVLFATDYWHECSRLTLLRPDGTCCSGPRHPADCAACRLTDRRPAKLLGSSVQHSVWQALALAGRVQRPVPINRILDVDEHNRRSIAIRDALDSVSMITVESTFLANRLIALGANPDRILILRQGVDRSELVGGLTQSITATNELNVIYLGQFSHHKGVDLAIEAVTSLRDQGYSVRLRAYGPRTGDPHYLHQLDRLGEHDGITLMPPISRDQLGRAIAESHVLVVPSRWYDNSPNVILEAFAVGRPVVVAGHGGMAEMVRDGVDGLHFQPDDAHSLARTLQRLCDEPELLDQLRAGIRQPILSEAEMEVEHAALTSILAERA